jgi:hypothetical protein
MLHTQRLVDAEKQSLEASSSTTMSRYRGMGNIEESADIEMSQRSYIATTPVGTYTGVVGSHSRVIQGNEGTWARGNTRILGPSLRPSLSPPRRERDTHALGDIEESADVEMSQRRYIATTQIIRGKYTGKMYPDSEGRLRPTPTLLSDDTQDVMISPYSQMMVSPVSTRTVTHPPASVSLYPSRKRDSPVQFVVSSTSVRENSSKE